MFIIAELQFRVQRVFMKHIVLFVIFTAFLPFQIACQNSKSANVDPTPTPGKLKIIADSFAYPIGKTAFATEKRDKKDNWYNAQDFTVNNHLGEDWNANSGGNTDCGEPVYAAANGTITYAEDAGTGWGNVIIITHDLPNAKKVQTLYGHLGKILKTEGIVEKREQIGTIGNASGTYLCHLHFELRDQTCLAWDQVFVGYNSENSGWLDPSEFIDKQCKK
jgi:murein DD-endopeptidase MepM/ murein hydrolase activator NlpD